MIDLILLKVDKQQFGDSSSSQYLDHLRFSIQEQWSCIYSVYQCTFPALVSNERVLRECLFSPKKKNIVNKYQTGCEVSTGAGYFKGKFAIVQTQQVCLIHISVRQLRVI